MTRDGQNALVLATIEIESAGPETRPNPVLYNFGDQLALVGYEIEPRRLISGETVELSLVWQSLDEMEIDYTIFTHLRDLEDPSNRIFAQHDAAPSGGTASWTKGQESTERYQLVLAEDTPPSVLEVEVGVYYQDMEGKFRRLQLVTAQGQLVDDFLILGKVRVD